MATLSYDFGGKVALITGASSGIGKAAALLFGKSNARVVVVYNANLKSALEVVGQIQDAGSQALAIQADVTNSAIVRGLFRTALKHFGQIDILVNCVGVTRDALTVRMSDEDWGLVLRTNLTGAFHCTREVLRPMFKQRWGRIANVSSVIGVPGNIGQGNYAAAKAGLIAYTKSVAKEVARKGITVNAVLPGCINTPMWQNTPESARKLLGDRIPVGEIGKPEDVANTIAFLASDEASYITGAEVVVDGGLIIS